MYQEYVEVLNRYNQAVLNHDNLFTAEHPLAEEYVNDVEQLFGITLTAKDVIRLLGDNILPNGLSNKLIGDLTSKYQFDLHNENSRLQGLVNEAKLDLYNLQETILLDYFRGDEQLFIQCETPIGFRTTTPRIESAFRQLLKVGNPKIWEYKIGVSVQFSAISFPLDKSKLQMFYTCWYNWLFGLQFPNYIVGNDIMKQVQMFYHIDCWNNGERTKSILTEFEDITSSYLYIA